MSVARRLSTKRLYEGSVLSLDIDEVEEPGAVRVRREIVRHRGSVGILPIMDDDRIVLIRQYRYPADAILWEIPAGRLDPNERPEDAARRELEEETGLSPAHLEPMLTYLTSPGFCDEVMHLFRATGLSSVPRRPDEDERIETAILSRAEAHVLLARGELRDAKTLVALLLDGERPRNEG
jgi:ADP-ribose pyrophosphatase